MVVRGSSNCAVVREGCGSGERAHLASSSTRSRGQPTHDRWRPLSSPAPRRVARRRRRGATRTLSERRRRARRRRLARSATARRSALARAGLRSAADAVLAHDGRAAAAAGGPRSWRGGPARPPDLRRRRRRRRLRRRGFSVPPRYRRRPRSSDAPWPTLRETAAAGVPQASSTPPPTRTRSSRCRRAARRRCRRSRRRCRRSPRAARRLRRRRLLHLLGAPADARVRVTRTHIHSWHHAYYAPFSWAGGVVHPAEDAVVVLCQIAAPLALAHHPLGSAFVFVTVLLIEEHSGHDVRWAPYNWMPFACPMARRRAARHSPLQGAQLAAG